MGRGFGLNLSVVTDPAKSRQLFGPGGAGTFSWPGAYGTWWQADPTADLILIYLIQNPPIFASTPRAVAGNTSLVKLQAPNRSSSAAPIRPSTSSGYSCGHAAADRPDQRSRNRGAGTGLLAEPRWLPGDVVELADGIRPADKPSICGVRAGTWSSGWGCSARCGSLTRAARRGVDEVRRQPSRGDAGNGFRRQRVGLQARDLAGRPGRRAVSGHQGQCRLPVQQPDFRARTG